MDSVGLRRTRSKVYVNSTNEKTSSKRHTRDSNDTDAISALSNASKANSKITKKRQVKPAIVSTTNDKSSVNKRKRATPAKHAEQMTADPESENRTAQFWLMKAEPESRIEKGKDVRFSIDDLAACTEPEGWDGVRNPVARNNMRAMRKGDLAFFYHSNCKTPGVVGFMEIVKEHSPDTSANDPKHPYFDPKDDPGKPKWSLVHVEFRRKFSRQVTLKEMQRYAHAGGELENLQTLRLSRLSVSKVTLAEWNFINSLAEAEE